MSEKNQKKKKKNYTELKNHEKGGLFLATQGIIPRRKRRCYSVVTIIQRGDSTVTNLLCLFTRMKEIRSLSLGVHKKD